MASASKGRRKRALEACTEQPAHKRVCTPSQGSRSAALRKALECEGSVQCQDCTPKKAEQLPTSAIEPITESTLKSSGISAPTPQSLKAIVAKLPLEHARLVESFGKLQQIVVLSKKRKQQCSFQNCQKPVETITGRQFTVKHLLQLKTVFPDALNLTRVMERRQEFPGSAGKMSQREAQVQILIDMPLLRESCSPSSLQGYVQQLAENILRWNADQSKDSQTDTEHSNDHPMLSAGKASSFDEIRGPQVGEDGRAPQIPEAVLPDAEVRMFAPEADVVKTPKTITPGPSSAKKPPSGLRSNKAKAKRLSFGTPGHPDPVCRTLSPVPEDEQPATSKQQLPFSNSFSPIEKSSRQGSSPGAEHSALPGSSACLSPATFRPCSDSPGNRPATFDNDSELAGKLRRQSLNGDIPVSLAALRAVNESAEIQASLTSADMVAARQHAANLACMPRTFDTLRALFGPSGPSVIPKPQVFSRMLGANQALIQKQELEGQISFLMQQIPGFVAWTERPQQGVVLRIDRKQDMKALREKVICLATS